MDRRIVVFAFFFLLFSGCAARKADAPVPAGNSSALSECFDSCRGLGPQRTLDLCRIGCDINEAESARDPSDCQPIRGYDNASMFYSSCLGDVAGLQGNVSVCALARNQSEKDWCILSSSERIKDPSICDDISDSVIRRGCIDSANSTIG